MNWFAVSNPNTGGVGCIPESALELHRANGWQRVSGPLDDDACAQFNPADWADAPDLDAPKVSAPPAPDEPAKSKEK